MEKPTEEIAEERIRRLFELAERVHEDSPERAGEYVERAREVGMRCRVRLPDELKRRFCGDCGSYYVFGSEESGARVRLNDGHVTITCEKCGSQARYPYDE
ncbi:MAG: ribonuclease P protein component 4 [Halobacteria archaeon]|nr:ribonuclease P protein component 4 [Halobacteria archaeon]